MKLNKQNNGGYSTILALLLVGFMIIVTTGVFNLVMNEMKDTRGMSHYFKAYAGAEAGIELGLLDIKNGENLVDIKEDNPKSNILSSKTKVIYNFDAYTDEVTRNIDAGEYTLIDLVDAENPRMTADANILWNIVGKDSGITGRGANFNPLDNGKRKTLNAADNFYYSSPTINDFLRTSEDNYLIIYNTNNYDINMTLNVGTGEKIYKDTLGIKSSGISGTYKQNLRLDMDKSGYYNFLKYSIFSQ